MPSLVFGDPAWSSYDLTLQGKWERGRAGFAIIFHHTGPGDQYGFVAYDRFQLACTYAGRVDRKWQAGGIKPGEWCDVRIEVRGDHFRCFLKGNPICDGQDERFKNGRVGLSTCESAARYRDIKVTAPDGTLLWNGLPELPGEPAHHTFKETVDETLKDLDRMRTERPPSGGTGYYQKAASKPNLEIRDRDGKDLSPQFTKAVDATRESVLEIASEGKPDAGNIKKFDAAADAAIAIAKKINGHTNTTPRVKNAGQRWINALGKYKKAIDEAAAAYEKENPIAEAAGRPQESSHCHPAVRPRARDL